MKRSIIAALVALIAAGMSTSVVHAQPTGAPTADFGTPPSGEIPILFNDRHVYSKPDTLRQNRVLAALVRGNTILVPLRSMFEQMGATVSYDPATRTADVSKPGSDVKVTVGRPEVIINGESRPLDVPPMIYRGVVVVPVRVLSEGMGAYVQWVPDRRIVVVRYVSAPVPTPAPPPPATPVPTAPPTLPPAPAPTPPPPTPKPQFFDHFIVGDYIFSPRAYNEFSPANHQLGPSYAGKAAVEFPLGNLVWMLAVDARQYAYPHTGDFDAVVPRNAPCFAGSPQFGNRGCVTVIGGNGNLYVPSFTAHDRDIDGRIGIRIAKPRIYIAGSWLWHNTNYGYPQMNGPGFGIEKLPDLDQAVSVFADYYHYPQIHGGFNDPTTGINYLLAYHYSKYKAGITVGLPILRQFGVFIEGGWMGDYGWKKQNAPSDFHHEGPFAGLGLRF